MAFHQKKPIAIGMVGGGPGSGIGETHRIAMRIDNKCELVAGAFSRSREKSLVVAKELTQYDCSWPGN
jgi:predicted dehydrogenase